MDVLYRLGRATAAEVLAELAGSPHYSTVRTQLRVLEEKGHVRHESDGLRYVVSAHCRPAHRAEGGAAPSGRDLFRRVGGERGYGAARPRCRPPDRRGSRSHRRTGAVGAQGGEVMAAMIAIRVLASLGVALAGAYLCRRRSAAAAALRVWGRASSRPCCRCRSGRLMPAWTVAVPAASLAQVERASVAPAGRAVDAGGSRGRAVTGRRRGGAGATSTIALAPDGDGGDRGVAGRRAWPSASGWWRA